MAAHDQQFSQEAPLTRRNLIKRGGAVAGGMALAGRLSTSALASGAASPSTFVHRLQETSTLAVGLGTDADFLDPRQINTQEAYIACANIYDCLVLYDLGAA